MNFSGFLLKAFFIIALISTDAWSDSHSLSDSDKLFKEATDFVKARQYEKAIKIFENLAKSSEHDAQYNLALLLKAGKGATKKYKTSLYWAFLAKLGWLIPKNTDETKEHLSQAKELVEDLIDLLPEKTVDTVRSDVKTYLDKKIEEGNQKAIMHLGYYFLEVVSEKQYASAYKWFTIGAALGIEGAGKIRDEVEKELLPEDIVEGQEKAEESFQTFVSKQVKASK